MNDATVRIAMWSGPRNISTAMMRSWGSRPDTVVVDEPFYARYLKLTGADHPGRDEVIASDETEYDRIVARMTGAAVRSGARGNSAGPAARIFYQKQMAHHMLPGDDLAWLAGVTNCFLIREPAAMIASFVKVVANPTAEQLGLPQQTRMFEMERTRTGLIPPVIDASDVLADPRGVLTKLCERIGVPFDDAMLAWAPGPRATDGVWAKHWYDAVHKSTGFDKLKTATPQADVPAELRGVLAECEGHYRKLYKHRVTC